MFYLLNDSIDPSFNLALEEYLLKSNVLNELREPIFVLWRNMPTVVIGRNQNAFSEINVEFVQQEGIKLVRRLTGGGAVYHDLGNLNYTFIAKNKESFANSQGEMVHSPKGEGTFAKNDSQWFDFALFTAPILTAMKKLGVPAELSGRNDLLIAGKKFSGNAQMRYHERILHHGTLLFDTSLETLAAALSPDTEKYASRAVVSVRSRVTNIAEHLPTDSCITDVLCFRDFLAKEIAIQQKLTPLLLNETALAEIDQIRQNRYATDDWNIGFSPPCDIRVKHRYSWGLLEVEIGLNKGIIRTVCFRGDFFALKSPEQIEQQLIGSSWNRDAVANRLDDTLLQTVFSQWSTKELLELLF